MTAVAEGFNQPFSALIAPVVDVLPGFAGDWPTAIRAILPRLAVSIWRELDARRVIDSAIEGSAAHGKQQDAMIETERLLKALAICRAQEGLRQ